MSESQRRSTQQLFNEAKNIHSTTRTDCSELQNKLQFMQRKIQNHSPFLSCGFCNRSQKGIDDGFKRAFKTLSLTEQVLLFWRMCTYIKEIKENKNVQEQKNLKSSNTPQKQMFDTTIYIKDKKQYKDWTVTRIKASIRTRKVTITDKSVVIDMHDYIIRSLKSKDRESFALQATNAQQPYQTIKISNEGHSYQQTVNFFKKIKKKALRDEIEQIIDPNARLSRQQIVEVKIGKLQRKISFKTSNISNISNVSSANIYDKMMTLKLVSPAYGQSPVKLIEKEMLQRQRVIRLRDTSYNQIYKTLIPPKLLKQLEDVSGFEEVKSSQFYQLYYNRKEQKVKKIYKFKDNDFVIFDWLVDQLNNFSNFKRWKTKMQSISCLRIFPSQKTKVFHEVYRHEGNKKTNYVYIRHHFDLPNPFSKGQNGSHPKNIYYFYDQSVVMPITKSYFGVSEPLAQIQYIIWKFYQKDDIINLVIEAKCDHFTTPQNNLKMVQSYLGEFQLLKNNAGNYNGEDQFHSEIMFNTMLFQNQYIQKIEQIEDIDNDTEFFTVTDTFNDQKGNTLMSGITKEREKSIGSATIKATFDLARNLSLSEDVDTANRSNLLKFRHPVQAYAKSKPNLVRPKVSGAHFQWQKQWVINQKGQLINTNKQKIQAQNNILKGVFKRLGRNIMSGKSILSISLPVDAFGDDSNLSRLCNSYGYAPLFLEDAAKQTDPVERLKRTMAFGMSCTVNYIRMDKPFNPILGQTYQSLIDGCPVYGQQVSHHPPISASFMKGRGYTLYSHLEAKVQLSLNSASGINQGQIAVCFSDDLQREKITYSTPSGQLTGLIYGERKMAMIRKSYFFDQQNLLYCQLKWGKSKGKSEFSNKYLDAVEGQIVKVNLGFDPKKCKNITKNDIQRQIGLINGRWTGAVFYNQEPLFDTWVNFPYLVQTYEALLQSDSSKRKDLILRSTAVDMQQAQLAKQELQQIQRRDRKLRAQYQKQK